MVRMVRNGVADFEDPSYRDSLDAVRLFVGDDIEKVRHLRRDPEYMIDVEPAVPRGDTPASRRFLLGFVRWVGERGWLVLDSALEVRRVLELRPATPSYLRIGVPPPVRGPSRAFLGDAARKAIVANGLRRAQDQGTIEISTASCRRIAERPAMAPRRQNE
jgi:hypothetical protein